MSIETGVSKLSDAGDPLVSARARGLTIWGGRIIVVITIAHFLLFTAITWPEWAGWATGGLWGADPSQAAVQTSVRDFWSFPGSFMLPTALLGLLASRLARSGQALPRFVPWTLAAWIVLCSWILFPSGFLLGLVPAGMLVAADLLNAQARRANHDG